jgi:hypothetical protein
LEKPVWMYARMLSNWSRMVLAALLINGSKRERNAQEIHSPSFSLATFTCLRFRTAARPSLSM